MKKLLILAGALALAGCATGRDDYYTTETARHATEKAKWEAMGRIAVSGDVTAKAVALALMGQAGGQQQVTAPPRSPVADLLQFAGIVLPAAVQGYGIRQQTVLGVRQSDNGARQSIAAAEYGFKGAESTNAAFVGIAGQIQAAGAVTTTTTTTSSANQANQQNVANQANQANPVDRHDVAQAAPAPVAQ